MTRHAFERRNTTAAEVQPMFSPDGHWIAYFFDYLWQIAPGRR